MKLTQSIWIRLTYYALSVFLNPCFAGGQTTYQPFEPSDSIKTKCITQLETDYEAISLPESYSDAYSEMLGELKDEKLTAIRKNIYSLDPVFRQFFDPILTEIKRANPTIKISNHQLMFSRANVPNAATYFDDRIVFNLALLAHCENESQVAFILCHEIAHQQLQHPQKAIHKFFETFYSKKGKQELKQLKRLRTNQYERVEAYLQNIRHNNRRHSRDNETEADSLAIVFLRNTRYDATQGIKNLLILDELDSILTTPRFDITKTFNSLNYPFKKRWLEAEDVLLGKPKVILNPTILDSLKTHPDCKVRAAAIQNSLVGYIPPSITIDSNTLNKVTQYSIYETLLATFQAQEIDECLFYTLNQLQKEPQNIFLHALVGQCFNAMYLAQKNHKFSESVALPKQNYKEFYLDFLRFLNNMSLKELGLVGYHYLDGLDKSYLKDEFMLYTITVAAANAGQQALFQTFKTQYIQQFPSGRFLEVIQKL